MYRPKPIGLPQIYHPREIELVWPFAMHVCQKYEEHMVDVSGDAMNITESIHVAACSRDRIFC